MADFVHLSGAGVRRTGLDPDRVHHVRPQPPGDAPAGNAAAWGAALPWCTPQGARLSGHPRGASGLRLPALYPDHVTPSEVAE